MLNKNYNFLLKNSVSWRVELAKIFDDIDQRLDELEEANSTETEAK